MKAIKIGDRFEEYMVPFPGKVFDWIYEIIGFKGDFAECNCIFPNGKTERVGIAIDLLKEGVFFRMIWN